MRLESSISGNMRKFLILELESSIYWNLGNSFRVDFLIFLIFGTLCFKRENFMVVFILGISRMVPQRFPNSLSWKTFMNSFSFSLELFTHQKTTVRIFDSPNFLTHTLYSPQQQHFFFLMRMITFDVFHDWSSYFGVMG